MSTEDLQSLAPVTDDARIDVMDILRGFALLGIILMNIEWFNRSATDMRTFDVSLTGLDHAVGWLIRAFVEGKFYKLFALLFGMGFAVMLLRAKEVGRPFGAWFARRMLVLMLIGYAHETLLWGGDILHDYAFAGLVFLGWVYLFETRWLRRFNTPAAFLKIGVVWLLLPFITVTFAGIGLGMRSNHDDITQQWQRDVEIAAAVEQRLAEPAPENEVPDDDDATTEAQPEDEAEPEELSPAELMEKEIKEWVDYERKSTLRAAEQVEIMSGGSYLGAVRYRISHLRRDAGNMVFFTLVLLIPIFLVGYWFIASGVLKHHREHQQLFRSLAIVGMVFGTMLSVGSLLIMQHPIWDISNSIGSLTFWMSNLGQLLLTAGYLGLIVVLVGQSWCSRVLNWLAPFGRMALSNYIMQTVILVLLFYGHAGGLYGELSRAPQMLVGATIVVLQIALSAWWLKRFRFGPLEWLWRSATYMSWQPLKKSCA